MTQQRVKCWIFSFGIVFTKDWQNNHFWNNRAFFGNGIFLFLGQFFLQRHNLIQFVFEFFRISGGGCWQGGYRNIIGAGKLRFIGELAVGTGGGE